MMEKQGTSSSGGLAILGVILAVCVVVAYFLSTIVSNPGPPVEEVVPGGGTVGVDQISEGETTGPAVQEPVTTQGPEPGFPPREGIEAIMAQVRGLAEICDGINAFHASEGRYPETLDVLSGTIGLTLPDNPFMQGMPVQPVNDGDFSPGGFLYRTYSSEAGGEAEGFIVFAYADAPANGMTMSNPGDMISPMFFNPPINGPLAGITVAMNEKGEVINLNKYSETSIEENED